MFRPHFPLGFRPFRQENVDLHPRRRIKYKRVKFRVVARRKKDIDFESENTGRDHVPGRLACKRELRQEL